MKTLLTRLLLSLAATICFTAADIRAADIRAADQMTDALQKGLFEEEANHNLEAAISAYQRVTENFAQQQKLAATAIYRLGECYRKLGRTNEAVAHYQRLLRDFSSETALVNLSRQNLAGLGGSTVQSTSRDLAGKISPQEDLEIQVVSALIKNSPDLINASSNDGTPLHKAASAGQLAVAEFLLQHGANVNSLKTRTSSTPLHDATRRGHKAMVELLLKNGADVDAQDNEQLTPLHLATASGFKTIVEVLLAAKANPNLRSGRNVSGFGNGTPLHFAAGAGAIDLMSTLLQHGAEVNDPNGSGSPPLAWLIWGMLHPSSPKPSPAQKQKAILFLIEKGAAVDVSDGKPLNLLLSPIRERDVAILEILLKNGANPNRVLADGRRPALHEALDSNPPDLFIVRKLLEYKADPNVLETSSNPRAYPLHTAASRGEVELVEQLIQAGATIDIRSVRKDGSPGGTPLMNAAFSKHTNVVAVLLRAGADPNAQEQSWGSILHWLAQENLVASAKQLLASKANPNARNSQERTPLHVAASNKHKEMIQLLLDHGADPNALDFIGKSPLNLLTDQSAVPRNTGYIVPQANLSTASRSNQNLPPGGAPSEPNLEELTNLLRSRGAVELPARERSIWVARPLNKSGTNVGSSSQSKAVFHRGTNDSNRYTLFETVTAFYSSTPWPFPDWSQVTINRLQPNERGDASSIIKIDLEKMFATQDCSGDFELEWGDIINIPEADHRLKENWPGLGAEASGTLIKCGQRQVVFVIKDETKRVILQRRFSGQPVPSSAVLESSFHVRDFALRTVVEASSLLRASSDRTRIHVLRPRNEGVSQVMIYDLTKSAYNMADDLWVRQGDVIVVPELDAPPLTEKEIADHLQAAASAK